MNIRPKVFAFIAATLLLSGCVMAGQAFDSYASAVPPKAANGSTELSPYRPDHIVIVVEENHSYSKIIGNPDAPFINALAKQGALLAKSYGVTHPSEPNYLALFSGSNQGVKDDSCPHTFSKPNLGSELIRSKYSFGGYSEDLPAVGSTKCSYKNYGRKHNPWSYFTNVPAKTNMPLTAFPSDFAKLPTVSFVIPNMQNDMHDGSVKKADLWLKNQMNAYIKWAKQHNSMLILTWDEDDFSKTNHIPTIIVGPMIKPGIYQQKINHLNVLRTIEDLYGLKRVGDSGSVQPIQDIWK
jgi:hypothetical protein